MAANATNKLFYKEKHAIGLDISQTGIKVMGIDAKHWLVQGYGSIDLDPAKMQEALDSDDDNSTYLAENLKRLFRENIVGTLPSNHCIIGVPTGKSYSRAFSLPADQEKTLADAIEIEVSQYIPIPMAALYVDYQIINRSTDQIHVIMSAVPRSLVDACMRAAVDANLRPVMVEPGINAVARVIQDTEEGHLATLIVDIGQASTDIAIFDKGAIRVSGGVGVGGNTFTLEIARKLGTALDNAHQLKVINGLNPGPRQAKLSRALEPSLERIATELKKVLRYYTERVSDSSKVEQILIVGAGSNVPGIGEYFTNALVMPARVASPWQKLDFGQLQPPSKQFRARYITVAGLASVNEQELWK